MLLGAIVSPTDSPRNAARVPESNSKGTARRRFAILMTFDPLRCEIVDSCLLDFYDRNGAVERSEVVQLATDKGAFSEALLATSISNVAKKGYRSYISYA